VTKVKITLVKSTNSANRNHIATIEALGLRKIGQSVVKESNDAVKGMVRRVAHLVKCEEA
jgi:large subunit ribosomal protein L30